MNDPLTKHVQKTFSLYGLTIVRKNAKGIADYLQIYDEDERESTLTKIVEQILSQNLVTANIEEESIKIAIKECHRSANALREEETVLNVIDMHTVPKVIYDKRIHKFTLTNVTLDTLSEPVNKPLVYKHRLELIWRRTLLHELFQPLKLGEVNPNKRKLTLIEYLNSNSVNGPVTILGMLTLMTETNFYLEDTSGYVKLDISKAKFDSGLIVEGTIVICDGVYDDEIMTVNQMCLPPASSAANSQAIFGNANTFGGPSPTSLKLSTNLKTIECSKEDGNIIFISDFWVNDVQVINKFKVLLDGYADFPPIAFVLCGHFLNGTLDSGSAHKLEEGFRTLADLVSNYLDIVDQSYFIFVPGPYDVGASKILPRASLPRSCLKYFMTKVPNTILAPNPCRIQYCTKEIIVIRENLLSKLCRNTLHFPDTGVIYEHFAETLISQAHLTPFTLPLVPIYWKYDHIMQMFPTPDLLVVADKFKPYRTQFNDCNVINPGSFAQNEFTFLSYIPAKNNVDECDANAQ